MLKILNEFSTLEVAVSVSEFIIPCHGYNDKIFKYPDIKNLELDILK
jgi:hypothetical protein